jgi:fatty-acid desaturase
VAASNRDPLAAAIVLDIPASVSTDVSRLALPEGVQPYRVDWLNTLTIGGYHAVALLAFMPMFFHWSAVIVAIVGARLFGLLGINIGYHRLLTHRGFKCPKWFEHTLAVIAICCAEDTPARWVAVHRRHHQYSDAQPDPHSPLAGFLWGHLGWLLVKNPELGRLSSYDRYARDILRDPFYANLERNFAQLKIMLIQWTVYYTAGAAVALAQGDSWREAAQYGFSVLLWGVVVRTVFVWHQTWAVNSITHLWGYRNYKTNEDSRNNLLIGYLAHGEGWHNNHHADPQSARHGHRWWELDTTYAAIRLFERMGLVWEIVEPRREAGKS